MLNLTRLFALSTVCALMPASSQAQTDETMTESVLVAIEDQDGQPVNLRWIEYDSKDHDGDCLPLSEQDDHKYRCVPMEFAQLRVDEKPTSLFDGPGLSYPKEGDVTWLQLSAEAGERRVAFPQVLTTEDKKYYVMYPEQAIHFQDGAVAVLRLRLENVIRQTWNVDDISSLGYFTLTSELNTVELRSPQTTRYYQNLMAQSSIEPGTYTLGWVNAQEASEICGIERAEAVSKAISDSGLCVDEIGNVLDVCKCRPGEHLFVDIIDGILSRSKTGTPTGDVPPKDVVITLDGKELSLGDVIAAGPGQQFEVRVDTRRAQTVQNGR